MRWVLIEQLASGGEKSQRDGRDDREDGPAGRASRAGDGGGHRGADRAAVAGFYHPS